MIGTAESRFWNKVNKTNGCWEWLAAHTNKGYGIFWNGIKLVYSHRYSYELTYGIIIPHQLQIDHLCRNPSCVNPLHMEIVTNRENVMRGNAPLMLKKRCQSITHCPQGHEYNENNTHYKWRVNHFERTCRVCARDYQKRKRGLKSNL